MSNQEQITPQFYEKLIIKLLFHNMEMREKIYPYLDPKYFDEDFVNTRIVKTLVDFMSTRDSFPNNSEMLVALKDKEIHDEFKKILAIDEKEYLTEFILDDVEDFFKKKLLFHSAERLLDVIKKEKADNAADVPEIISDALAFGFKTDIGLDFTTDEEKVYNSINQTGNVTKTGLNFIDLGIDGGLHEKSLVLLFAGTNVGKTAFMCGIGTELLLKNKNVLYVTFEDSEEKISNRFLVNLMGASVADLRMLTKDRFHSKYNEIKNKLKGKLVIKEYPEGTVSAFHIEQLLKDLKIKKNFTPDVIFIDYIGCMVPNGKPNANINSYETLKLIAGQVRAISMKKGTPVVSAMQSNRGGLGKELSMDNAADSVGQVFKADGICALYQTPEMKAAGMVVAEWIKSRFGVKKKFKVYFDINLQRVQNVEGENGESLQENENLDMAVVKQYENNKPKIEDNANILIDFD